MPQLKPTLYVKTFKLQNTRYQTSQLKVKPGLDGGTTFRLGSLTTGDEISDKFHELLTGVSELQELAPVLRKLVDLATEEIYNDMGRCISCNADEEHLHLSGCPFEDIQHVKNLVARIGLWLKLDVQERSV